MSQADLAKSLDISRQAYTHLESGQRRIRLDQAEHAFNELGFAIEAVEAGINSQVSEFSKAGLAKILYRRIVAGPNINMRNLLDCMRLSDDEMYELNLVVRAFLDSKNMRKTLVATCQAIAESNKA